MADYYYHHTGIIKLFAITVYGIPGGRMIAFALIRKMLVSIAPLALFFILRNVAKGQHLPKRKSHTAGFDPSTPLRASTSKIVEGEIVEEKK